MKHTARTLIATLAFTFFGPTLSDASTSQDLAPAVDPVEISGADAEMTVTITRAVERYEEAGLSLPPLRFYVHETIAGCGDRRGLYTAESTSDRIDLCVDNEFLVYHELGHAWEHHALSDHDRQAYVDHVGLETWNAAATPWMKRGMESLANAIAHSLLPEELTPAEAEKLAPQFERYHFLTDRPSPRL